MKPQKRLSPKHFLGIDVIRFLAAASVMWFHYGFLMGAHPAGMAGAASQGLVSFPEVYEFSNFGWVGVQTFFVISGFVIAFSGENSSPFNFFVSRFVRLGPGVWICASITLVAALLVGYSSVLGSFRSYVQSVFFVPFGPWIDSSYWTLAVEIAFYSIVYVLIRMNRFFCIRTVAILLGTFSGLFWICAAVAQLSGSSDLHKIALELHRSRLLDLLLVHHGVFFALGVFLWLELTKESMARNILWCAAWCGLACIQISMEAESLNLRVGTFYSPFIPCVLWLLSVAGIVMSVKGNLLLHRAPQAVLRSIRAAGLMTFPLYLLHQVVGCALMGWIVKIGGSRWWALGTTIVFLLFASWLVAMHLEPLLQKTTKAALFRLREWRAQQQTVFDS